jgi:GT2 family glycosyltransferase
MTNPLVSLVLVTYNSDRELTACMDALAGLDYEPFEVIVVDNASQDDSVAVAQARAGVEVIVNARNEGFGAACNLGAARAGGELIMFLNPDIVMTPGCLTTLVAHLRERPDAGIICPTVLSSHETLSPPQGEVVSESGAVPGCSLMVTRRAWRDIPAASTSGSSCTGRTPSCAGVRGCWGGGCSRTWRPSSTTSGPVSVGTPCAPSNSCATGCMFT